MRLMMLLVTLQLMLDAIALREMHLHEVTKEKRRTLPTMMKHLRMPPMLEITRMKRTMKPMLQLILRRLQHPKTRKTKIPRTRKTRIPKPLKQDNADVDVAVDAEADAADAATIVVTTIATTPSTTTAATTNTIAATITATNTAATKTFTTTTATTTATTTNAITATLTRRRAATHADVAADAAVVVTEREREEPLPKLNSGTHLDGAVLTGLVMVWRANPLM